MVLANRKENLSANKLRVALLAGTLGQGGAEKQLVYMVQALSKAGVEVRVYSLTRGEFYEKVLQTYGFSPVWVGRYGNFLARLSTLSKLWFQFQPHIVQSAHVFANLYVGLAGRILNIVSIGAIRSSLQHSRSANGYWMRWLLTTPNAIVVNSQAAQRELAQSQLVKPKRLHLLPNVIELSNFERIYSSSNIKKKQPRNVTAIFIGRLIPVKRLDRFLHALTQAHQRVSNLRGLVVGDGPERSAMEELSFEIGLLPKLVTFGGQRDDIPNLLKQADMLVLCSDREGFPNVLLEAMAARRAVITTPAGDASAVVQDGVTGYVVPFNDIEGLAERMVQLAQSPQLRHQMGEAGRKRVEQHYSFEKLANRLLSIYEKIARQQNNERLLNILPSKNVGSYSW